MITYPRKITSYHISRYSLYVPGTNKKCRLGGVVEESSLRMRKISGSISSRINTKNDKLAPVASPVSVQWHGTSVCWYLTTRLESGPVTAKLTTTVVYSYKLMRNDIKLVHSHQIKCQTKFHIIYRLPYGRQVILVSVHPVQN